MSGGDYFDRIPEGLLPDLAVTLRHAHGGGGTPTRDHRENGERNSGFQHASAPGIVPEIVEPALDTGRRSGHGPHQPGYFRRHHGLRLDSNGDIWRRAEVLTSLLL